MLTQSPPKTLEERLKTLERAPPCFSQYDKSRVAAANFFLSSAFLDEINIRCADCGLTVRLVNQDEELIADLPTLHNCCKTK